jgi:hypothetical protein
MENNQKLFWGWYVVGGAFIVMGINLWSPLLFWRVSQTDGGGISLVAFGNIAGGRYQHARLLLRLNLCR